MAVRDSFHISWQNDIAAFSLAADVTVETAYPLTNCQNSTANEWAAFDMTAETTVAITGSSATTRIATCFRAHNHTAPDGTTLRLRLYAGETQTGTLAYDSGATDVMHNIPFGSLLAGYDPIEGNFEDAGRMKTGKSFWFETVEYKSFQIDITNASGFTNNVLLVDKFWLGVAFCPQDGPERGFGSTQIDDSEHQRKPGGGMETVQGVIRRSLNIAFKGVSQAERNTLRHILDRAKMGGDLLIAMDPNDAQGFAYETDSIYRRTSQVGFINQFYNGNEFGLSAEEN